MDKKTLEGLKVRMSLPVIMLVVALVIAGIVSFWSYGLLQKKTVEQAAPADTQQVAVAAYDLKWGTVITNEVVKTQPYLKGSLPTGYIADPAIGRRAGCHVPHASQRASHRIETCTGQRQGWRGGCNRVAQETCHGGESR